MDNFKQEYENKGKSMALKEVQEQQQTTKSLLEINSKPSIEIANEDLVSSGWDNGQVFCKIELRNNIGDGSKEFSMPAYQNHLKKGLQILEDFFRRTAAAHRVLIITFICFLISFI